uniref:Brevinin-1Ta n=1 Tax=Rana temporaria TaxID=8407 RepID=BR1A_RANTE|nr:RecName: Full=Brevinin-1Ta [Rana temporaria]
FITLLLRKFICSITKKC